MRLLFAAVFLWATGSAFAHEAPFGEIYPAVTANQDGSFTVMFRYYDGEREGWLRMMLGADGKERVPRHWVPKEEHDGDRERPSRESPDILRVDAEKKDATSRALLIRREGKGGAEKTTARVLPFHIPGYCEAVIQTAGKEAASVYGDVLERGREQKDEVISFKLTWCRSGDFQAARTVRVGAAGCIYETPSASPPVWSAGRWWVAWVRAEKKEDKSTWTTVLSGVDAATGKVEHHDLPGNSNWNTSVSLVVNGAGTFCAAWHASVDGTYPGKARIVTAVFTPEK